MSVKCVIFDFDGTLTDVDEHAPAYEDAFRGEIARCAHVERSTLDAAWREASARILAAPEAFGWRVGGREVAPATADPYLFANSVAQLAMDNLHVLPGDIAGRAQITYEAYRASYRRVPTRFRPGTRDALDGLVASGLRVFVATNAYPDDVNAKLAALELTRGDAISVRGDARKFEIADCPRPDPRFAALPEAIALDGLTRPVLIRRGPYFAILAGIWETSGCTPEATLVCGDIFELDLALPYALGAHVHLLEHARTLPHERRAVSALPRGAVGPSLEAVVARVMAV